MKLNAAREALLRPLQSGIGVVERRQTMPILANVLLVARDGQVSITATDLEVELVAVTDVDVDSPGEVTGVPTGFADLDEKTSGFSSGTEIRRSVFSSSGVNG